MSKIENAKISKEAEDALSQKITKLSAIPGHSPVEIIEKINEIIEVVDEMRG